MGERRLSERAGTAGRPTSLASALTPRTEGNSKWTKDPSVRTTTEELSEENVGVEQQDTGLGSGP